MSKILSLSTIDFLLFPCLMVFLFSILSVKDLFGILYQFYLENEAKKPDRMFRRRMIFLLLQIKQTQHSSINKKTHGRLHNLSTNHFPIAPRKDQRQGVE
jgi:hypothetical protein